MKTLLFSLILFWLAYRIDKKRKFRKKILLVSIWIYLILYINIPAAPYAIYFFQFIWNICDIQGFPSLIALEFSMFVTLFSFNDFDDSDVMLKRNPIQSGFFLSKFKISLQKYLYAVILWLNDIWTTVILCLTYKLIIDTRIKTYP